MDRGTEEGRYGELVSKPRGIALALLAILLSSFSQYTLILQQGIYLIALPQQHYDDFMAFLEAINISKLARLRLFSVKRANITTNLAGHF